MSMMAYGITHCQWCLQPYINGKCNCTRKREEENKKKLDLLLDMTEDEIKALKRLAKEKIENQLEG